MEQSHQNFEKIFKENEKKEDRNNHVVIFPNLGKDAVLVCPVP
jgi:hypothetical protein